MTDHGRCGSSGNREVNIKQNLPFTFVAKVDMVKDNLTPLKMLDDERFCTDGISNFLILIEQRKQFFHIRQTLLDFTIKHTKKIEWHIQLQHKRIDQNEITNRHGAIDDAKGCTP